LDKNYCDASRAQRGASRQLKLIFHSVPIHPRLQGGDESAHTGKRWLAQQLKVPVVVLLINLNRRYF